MDQQSKSSSSSDTAFSSALKLVKEYWGAITSAFLLLGAIQVLVYYYSIEYLPPGLSLSDLTVIFALVAAVSIIQVLPLAFSIVVQLSIYHFMKWKPDADLFRVRVQRGEALNLSVIFAATAVLSLTLVLLIYEVGSPIEMEAIVLTTSCVILGLLIAAVLMRELIVSKDQLEQESVGQTWGWVNWLGAIVLSTIYGLFIYLLFIFFWLVPLIDGSAASDLEKIQQLIIMVVTLPITALLIWLYLPSLQRKAVSLALVILLLPIFFNQPSFFPEAAMRIFKVGSYETELPVLEDTYKFFESLDLHEQSCTKSDVGGIYLCKVTVLSSLGANIFIEFETPDTQVNAEEQDGQSRQVNRRETRLEIPKELLGPRAFREVQPSSSNQQ